MAKPKAAKKSRTRGARGRVAAVRRKVKRQSSRPAKTARASAKKRQLVRKSTAKSKVKPAAASAKAPKSRLSQLRAANARRLAKARAAKAKPAKAAPVKPAPAKPAPAKLARARTRSTSGSRGKSPRLERERRVLSEPTLPSSLDLDRHGSAARSGRHELQHTLEEHTGMTPSITGGDVDADWENAYFSGDEAPGGDNPTPDQDRVDDIGRSLGLQYEDAEELQGDEKIEKRDKHRWELDPASSEDYRER